jgi:hypothetical protein
MATSDYIIPLGIVGALAVGVYLIIKSNLIGNLGADLDNAITQDLVTPITQGLNTAEQNLNFWTSGSTTGQPLIAQTSSLPEGIGTVQGMAPAGYTVDTSGIIDQEINSGDWSGLSLEPASSNGGI